MARALDDDDYNTLMALLKQQYKKLSREQKRATTAVTWNNAEDAKEFIERLERKVTDIWQYR